MFFKIRRGEIWNVDFSPVEGHEQDGTRPALIMSSDAIDINTIELAFAVPGTRSARTDPSTNELLADVVRVEPSKENGLTSVTYFLCNQLRAISLNRLTRPNKRIGVLDDSKLFEIEEILIALLDLGPK